MSNIINNIFTSVNNLTTIKKTPFPEKSYSKQKREPAFPALKQGEKFKMYQTKIANNLEKKSPLIEGFDSLTAQTNNVIQTARRSLQGKQGSPQQYNSTVNEYDEFMKKIKNSTTDYFDRVNPNNPYLGKNVCLSDGTCGYVTQQGVFKPYPDSQTFTNTAGKNGCPKATIKINGQGDTNNVGSAISSIPPLVVGTPMQSGQSCGNEGSTVMVNRLISDPVVSYVGCYADNTTTPLMTFLGATNTSSSYNECKDSAINGGYRYFGLQGVDYSTAKGYCSATNDLANATSLGNSYVITGQTALWSSGTIGDNQGSIAQLNGDGTMVVNNNNGTTIFTTPVPESVKTQPNPYIGCYSLGSDSKNDEISGRYTMTFDQCQDLATDKGYQYFGVGGNNRGDMVKRCMGYSDLTTAQQNGLSQKCKSQTAGGSSSASIYATDNNTTLGNSFLILQDDGNMSIYGGTSPSDNQGLIWSSGTAGKQGAPNPQYSAANGKYGKNWITSDSTLAAGDFVGSKNGNLALIMQNDGNLVLYAFSQKSNCKKMSDGNYGAGVGGNSLYDIGKVGNVNVLSHSAYIDQDANLHAIEGMQTAANIDSNMYDSYVKSDASTNTTTNGLQRATATQRERLAQLQSQLDSAASQMATSTGNYGAGLQQAQAQSRTNIQGVQTYLDNLKTTNIKIKHFNTNVENILKDSDIVVLQKNYEFILWSILAIGSAVVAFNVVKNKAL